MVDKNALRAVVLAAVLVLGGWQSSMADPPRRLNPFPEDAALAEPAPPARATKPRPPKSTFQPKFRTPAVKQAQHLEPADETPIAKQPESATSGAPGAEAAAEKPAAATAPVSEGKAILDTAFAKSQVGKTEAEFTEVIELCKQANAVAMSKPYQDYARQLLGWAYDHRGEVRAKDNRHVDALADFEAAVKIGGTWRAINNRGASYAAQGRDEEAMADFDRAITLNRHFSGAWFNRGELRSKLNDNEGAIRDYTAAIALGKPTSAMYASRAHAYYRMQRFGDALRDYGEAVKLDPANVAALINRGDTYSDVGKYGEAAKDYRAAVKVAPENGRAYQAAAWLMATCPDSHYRDDALSIDAAKRAIEIDGPSYRNLSTLAAAQASAGMFAEAKETQEKAITAAAKEDVVTAEKMMSLYQREIAYRDRPFTAFETPEEMDDNEVQQASGAEPVGPGAPQGRRAWFSKPAAPEAAAEPQTSRLPSPGRRPPDRGVQRPPTRTAPKGRI